MLLYNSLSPQEAHALVQCRTDHSYLQTYLHRIKQAPSAVCSCGHGEETVHHVILVCRKWDVQRASLRQKIGERWGDLSFMLGGRSKRVDTRTHRLVDGPANKWNLAKSRLAAIAVAKFLVATKRFTTSYNNNEDNDDDDDSSDKDKGTLHNARRDEQTNHTVA
jgi:hypothetical protein